MMKALKPPPYSSSSEKYDIKAGFIIPEFNIEL
jgi:hypothetical protein